MTGTSWRTDKPDLGVVVEVWAWLEVVPAIWDGADWRTPGGRMLRYISHWRERVTVDA